MFNYVLEFLKTKALSALESAGPVGDTIMYTSIS